MWTLLFIVLGFLFAAYIAHGCCRLRETYLARKAEYEQYQVEILAAKAKLRKLTRLADNEQTRLECVQQQTVVATQNFTRVEAKHHERQQERLQIFADYQAKVKQYEATLGSQIREIARRQRLIDECQVEQQEQQELLEKLKAEVFQYRRTILHYRTNASEEEAVLNQLTGQMQQRQQVIAHYQQMVNEQNATLEQLSGEVQQRQEMVGRYQAAILEVETTLRQMAEQLLALQQRVPVAPVVTMTPLQYPLIPRNISPLEERTPTLTLDFTLDQEQVLVVRTPGTPDPVEAVSPLVRTVVTAKSPNFQELETFYGRFLSWKPNTEDFDLLRIYTQGVTRGEQRWLNVISKKWNAEADPRQVVNNKYRIFGPKKTDLDFLVYILEHENVAPIEGLDTDRSGASSLRNECWERDARLAKAAKVEVACFCCQIPLKKDNKWEMCHLLPRAHGGQNELSNVRVGCTACNRGEGGIHNMHALEYMILKEMPGLKSIKSTDRKLQAIQFLRQTLKQFQSTFADIPEGIQKDLQPSNSPRIRILAIARYLQDRL
jgi:hypothetical protein